MCNITLVHLRNDIRRNKFIINAGYVKDVNKLLATLPQNALLWRKVTA